MRIWTVKYISHLGYFDILEGSAYESSADNNHYNELMIDRRPSTTPKRTAAESKIFGAVESSPLSTLRPGPFLALSLSPPPFLSLSLSLSLSTVVGAGPNAVVPSGKIRIFSNYFPQQ